MQYIFLFKVYSICLASPRKGKGKDSPFHSVVIVFFYFFLFDARNTQPGPDLPCSFKSISSQKCHLQSKSKDWKDLRN